MPSQRLSRRVRMSSISLKQALAAQGFKGGTRGDTEWNQWVSVEKSALAFVMERHGIEWEHKGSHEKHLSVLDYKKQERATELEQLGAKIEEKQTEFNVLRKDNGKLANENKKLVTQNRDYNLLRKVFGSKQIDELLAKAKEPKQSKQRDERFRKNKDYER